MYISLSFSSKRNSVWGLMYTVKKDNVLLDARTTLALNDTILAPYFNFLSHSGRNYTLYIRTRPVTFYDVQSQVYRLFQYGYSPYRNVVKIRTALNRVWQGSQLVKGSK